MHKEKHNPNKALYAQICQRPARKSTKGKAPPPPPLAKGFDGANFTQNMENPNAAMDQKENLMDKDIILTVVLPGGTEKTATVHGSKPMMDLLVALCSKYHLNPSSHTIELISTNRNQIKFKPNALIGTLNAEKIILKPKGTDEKNKKAAPQMPEATVRLVINYKKTQKTVLRVNPKVPLEELISAVSEKCEFDPKSTVLLKDVHSQEPLDLSKSLNDHGIREVYAKDGKGVGLTDLQVSSVHQENISQPNKDKILKEKEKGFFSIFRKSKKKPDQSATASAPASPTLNQQRPGSMSSLSAHASMYNSNTLPSEMPKKRRAPLPPMMVSQSFPTNLSECQTNAQPEASPTSDQDLPGLSRGSSSESSLKRTKRKAPPPPSPPSKIAQDEDLQDRNIKAGVTSPCILEEINEKEEMVCTAAQDAGTTAVTQAGEHRPHTSADAPSDTGKIKLTSLPTDVEMPSSSTSKSEEEDKMNDVSTDGKQSIYLVSNRECDQQILKVSEDSVTSGLNHGEDSESSPTAKTEDQQSTNNESKIDNNTEVCISLQSTPADPSNSQNKNAKPVMHDVAIQSSDFSSNGRHVKEQSDKDETEGICNTRSSQDKDIESQNTIKSYATSSAGVQDSSTLTELCSAEMGGLKKDMATSTEELSPRESVTTLPQVTEGTSECQIVAAQSPPIYKKDSEPKPKPSNEVTREYIPKVGLTTYKIVPQKSLEKLKFFEVQLTLEVPDETKDQGLSVNFPEHSDIHLPTKVPQDSVDYKATDSNGIHNFKPSSVSEVNSNHTANNNIAPFSPSHAAHVICKGSSKDSKPLSPSETGNLLPSTSAVKEKKIPPATKPKPGSFRLSQHKRTPGDYVTSAAIKNVSACSGSGHNETLRSPGKEKDTVPEKLLDVEDENYFPPPPPPVQFEEVSGESFQEEAKPANKTVDIPASKFTRQFSLPSKEPAELSLEKLRSFAAPKPYTPSTPSPFALAVSSAVRRTQSLSRRPVPTVHTFRGLPSSAYLRRSAAEPGKALLDSSPERDHQDRKEGKMKLPMEEHICRSEDNGIPVLASHPSGQGMFHKTSLEAVQSGDVAAKQKNVPSVSDAVAVNGGTTAGHPATQVE
ncbi:cordon-bleu protein-like 1b isoform X1 [Lepisosteus oculatus]|uniref:cordon-bleu protein-like 1b isoform X1 n=2 Tax=Lepisosteus oculatus TaxID=7918 RepID=UPI0035F5195C